MSEAAISSARPGSLVSAELLRRLSRTNPAISIGHIALEWCAIGLCIALCERLQQPALYVVAVAFIAARQHALLILMHEGVHRRLCENRFWNDFFAEVFCAWPCLLPMRGMRRHHVAHHRHTNTSDDPDFTRKIGRGWTFPQRRRELLGRLLLDASGANFWILILMFGQVSRWDRPRLGEIAFQLARLGFYAAAGWLVLELGVLRQLAMYWLVPLCTWLVLSMHIRSIAEHFAVERSHYLSQTRTVVPSLFDRVFLMPKNISYHIEHHLYPSVPFFRLPQLHAALTRDATYLAHAHVTYSYWGALREFCGAPRASVKRA